MSIFLLAELNEVLDRLRWGPSQSPHRIETSDTSGDEADSSEGRRKILSKKKFRMKKMYAATDLGRFFVTEPSEAANMASRFFAGCAGKLCLCSHMDIMKCCGISGAVITLPVITASVWKYLGGACWTSTEIY